MRCVSTEQSRGSGSILPGKFLNFTLQSSAFLNFTLQSSAI